mgnify:FL=1
MIGAEEASDGGKAGKVRLGRLDFEKTEGKGQEGRPAVRGSRRIELEDRVVGYEVH